VDIAIDRRLWLIAECHGLDVHSRNSYKPLTADFLEQTLDYIRERTADAWVRPFGEVFQYLSLRKATRAQRKDLSDVQAEIVLHSSEAGKALPVSLTVVLKVNEADISVVTAQTADGRSLKAWHCDSGRVCVDVNAYDSPVRVTWGIVQK
jgi:hypothetical protein